MPHFIPTFFLLLAFAWGTLTQTLPLCSTGCFQGTPLSATSPGDASLCPLAPGVATPFLTPSCLCFTPESFTGPEPFTFCFTCGQTTTGDFSSVCGTSQVTQSCSNQQDVISKACNANDDINTVLGALCEDGEPTSAVTDVGTVVEFVEPELAAGALALIKTGCSEVQIGQAISDVVSDICTVWNIAGCAIDAASASTGSPASTSAGDAASTTAGKPASTSTGKPASTSTGSAASAGASNATSASTGSANIASTTAGNAASTSTAPAGSSTGSATTLLSGLYNILYATISLAIASVWVLLVY